MTLDNRQKTQGCNIIYYMGCECSYVGIGPKEGQSPDTYLYLMALDKRHKMFSMSQCLSVITYGHTSSKEMGEPRTGKLIY